METFEGNEKMPTTGSSAPESFSIQDSLARNKELERNLIPIIRTINDFKEKYSHSSKIFEKLKDSGSAKEIVNARRSSEIAFRHLGDAEKKRHIINAERKEILQKIVQEVEKTGDDTVDLVLLKRKIKAIDGTKDIAYIPSEFDAFMSHTHSPSRTVGKHSAKKKIQTTKNSAIIRNPFSKKPSSVPAETPSTPAPVEKTEPQTPAVKVEKEPEPTTNNVPEPVETENDSNESNLLNILENDSPDLSSNAESMEDSNDLLSIFNSSEDDDDDDSTDDSVIPDDLMASFFGADSDDEDETEEKNDTTDSDDVFDLSSLNLFE